MLALSTRLRSVKASSEAQLERWVEMLGFRIEIKEIVWKEKEGCYALFFVPAEGKDVQSTDLRKANNGKSKTS